MEQSPPFMKRLLLMLLLGLSLTIIACGSGTRSEAAGTDSPARAVENYLDAKVRGDGDEVRVGLCADMEAKLERESRAFESVSNVAIENMSCASDDPASAVETIVRCSGEIVALYGTEETEFPLTSYRAVNEDGEWKWCGESE